MVLVARMVASEYLQVLLLVFGIGFLVNCAQVAFLTQVCECLHLPFKIRVVKRNGFHDEEDEIIHHAPSPYNRFRFNVVVDIDGFIQEFQSRG
jgi:hypothetical protein